MKNITVSVSDKAYHAARLWATANCTSISAAVQTYIEMLPKLNNSPGNLELINRTRQQARARDRAARKAAAEAAQRPATQPSAAGIFSALKAFIQKHAETVQH